jgi:threonine aldolase
MCQYATRNKKLSQSVICDLRSDTVTMPDSAMRAAMVAADVGDDVYGEDLTVNRLEAAVAERLGKEAGLFLVSGTQSNLVGMLSHCARGDEILTGRGYHIYKYEAVGASVLGGIAFDPLNVARDGGLEPEAIRTAIKDVEDPHNAITRLVGLDNTHNGRAVPISRCQAVTKAARTAGLSVHLDGARFFNAIEALSCSETELANLFDTISVCLSKGLGAPVGSVLVGQKCLIDRARRWRKMLGGGTRQSGMLAAAGLYALGHNVERLREDRLRAEWMARALAAYGKVEQATNMIFFTPNKGVTPSLISHMAHNGVKLSGPNDTMRLVIHKDITDRGLEVAVSAFQSSLG